MNGKTNEDNSIPLDPDLFNPDVVGTVLAGFDDRAAVEEKFYPVDDGWDLDQEDLYYNTDDEENETGLPQPQAKNDANYDRLLYPDAESNLSEEDSGEDNEQEEDDEEAEDGDDSEGYEASDNEPDSSDLRRLIGAIHAKNSSNDDEDRGILGKEWDRSMDEELNEIQESEKGTRRGKRKKYKLRGEPELSVEVSVLLGKANLCFVEKKYDEAIPLFEEVVRIEPMCKMAWNNLGAIYQDLGEFEKSCQFRMIGAHLTAKSTEIWKELGAESRQHGLLSQAIYCYSEAIKSGKDEVEAMWDRSYLLYQIGRPRQSLAGYLAILKFTPNNPDVLREVAHLCDTTGERELPIKLFQDAFKHYQKLMPTPDPLWLQDGFGVEHVRTLVKLLMGSQLSNLSAAQNPEAPNLEEEERLHNHYYSILQLIKRSNRWLQGRWDSSAENYVDWDRFEDDREYDPERMTREGWEDLSDTFYENCPVYPLGNDFRAYLGICRLKIGDEEEAALHFECIKSIAVEKNSELFVFVGDAYKEAGQWAEALEFYHDLSENDSTNNPAVWHKIGECYRRMGSLEAALECYEAVNETDPLDLVAKTQLAEIYELLGNRSKAFDMVNDIIETRRNARESGATIEKYPSSEYPNGPASKSNNTLTGRSAASKSLIERRLEEEMRTQRYLTAYDRLEEISSKMSTPEFSDDLGLVMEYVRLANPLVEGFRRTPALFPCDLTSKFSGLNYGGGRPGKRGESTGKGRASTEEIDPYPSSPDFRGIQFNNWVRIFVHYAFCCCKASRCDEACEVLDHVVRAPVFRQSASMQQVLRLAYAAAAYQQGDYVLVTDTIRWLSRRLAFHSDPVRLISALFSRGFPESIAFFNSNTQKWLLRQMKIIDNITGKLKSENRGLGTNPIESFPDQGGLGSKGSAIAQRDVRPENDKDDQSKNYNEEAGGGHDDVEEEEEEHESYWKPSKFKPKDTNPVFIITFGQILAGTRSFKSAIVYYLRLYETYPDDQLLNLLLAVAYVHRAMQRQTDNRHHQIVQALAFWDHYRKLRSDSFGQEVEYNLARLFHGLGLNSLAVAHYNRVLSMSKVNDDSEPIEDQHDLSEMAAYNLVLIYSTSGSMDLANEIIQKYLSV